LAQPKPVDADVAVASPRPELSSKPTRGDTAANSKLACRNPGALGTSRVVEIDTTGGPGFGFEHFKQHDFLRDKEVVLTFDDGPWPTTTAVVKALADECVLATFFAIGKHATYYPEILRGVAEAGHTVGSHTWSHQELSAKSADEAKAEIEKGISAVQWALGDTAQEAPFFRFPALRHPSEMVTYLGERNIAVFSTDMDSFDFKLRKPEQIIKSIMTKLQKHGKGIVLMHDFQSGTSHAVPQLLTELKSGGYRIVHLRSRAEIKTLPKYDEELQKHQKLPTVSQRPTSDIIRDIQ
jgi:peptidoglycan/xylan/chitin deacetylase (PgdA/CDA1 family)